MLKNVACYLDNFSSIILYLFLFFIGEIPLHQNNLRDSKALKMKRRCNDHDEKSVKMDARNIFLLQQLKHFLWLKMN